MLELQCLKRSERKRKSPITAVSENRFYRTNVLNSGQERKHTTIDFWSTEDELVGTNSVKQCCSTESNRANRRMTKGGGGFGASGGSSYKMHES